MMKNKKVPAHLMSHISLEINIKVMIFNDLITEKYESMHVTVFSLLLQILFIGC